MAQRIECIFLHVFVLAARNGDISSISPDILKIAVIRVNVGIFSAFFFLYLSLYDYLLKKSHVFVLHGIFS